MLNGSGVGRYRASSNSSQEDITAFYEVTGAGMELSIRGVRGGETYWASSRRWYSLFEAPTALTRTRLLGSPYWRA